MGKSTGVSQEDLDKKEAEALEAARKQADEDQKVAAEAAAKAKEEAEKDKKSVDGLSIVKAMVKKVPNCGFVSLNGQRITLAKQGEVLQVPEAYVKAFPAFLAG